MIYSNLTFGQVQKNALLSNPDYYVYNNAMDTLYLTKIDVYNNETFRIKPIKSTKVYNTIQIDGIGSKEIVFERTYSVTKEIIMQASQSKKIQKEIFGLATVTRELGGLTEKRLKTLS